MKLLFVSNYLVNISLLTTFSFPSTELSEAKSMSVPTIEKVSVGMSGVIKAPPDSLVQGVRRDCSISPG